MKPRRDLTPFPLAKAVQALLCGATTGSPMITMSEGQWDGMLSSAYDEGWILLELDDDEKPVRAYKKVEEPEEPIPWKQL